jgi:hypothetical protein
VCDWREHWVTCGLCLPQPNVGVSVCVWVGGSVYVWVSVCVCEWVT